MKSADLLHPCRATPVIHEAYMAARSPKCIGASLCLSALVVCALQAACVAGEVCSDRGIVVTASPEATAVGAEILGRGGNAIDAAVAVGFALAVTYPRAGNIGGGGFLLARFSSGATVFVDFRERAPLGARRDMYLDERGNVIEGLSLVGPLASGVPGSVAGLAEAHRLYGSLPWRTLLEPAVRLARDGFRVSGSLANSLQQLDDYRDRFPGLAQFARPDGSALREGDTLRQPDLAGTLRSIADEGPGAFYHGRIADQIVAEMKSSGGIITKEDLAVYDAPLREPLRGSYRGYEIISAPPPSSGGAVLIEILNIVEGLGLNGTRFLSDRGIHLLVEAERRAYVDRARYLGDPDFWKNPLSTLLSKRYASRLRSSISQTATPSSSFAERAGGPTERGETTHYSIIDSLGNAVAVTTTLNDSYGSKVVVRGAGFLLNNEMDDFSVKPGVPNLYGLVGGEANAIAPGKRMLSSMAPTIVLKDGGVFLILGTPGGSTIITTIAQVIIDMVDYGMTLEEAVSAPRFHHQWMPDQITVEAGALPTYLVRTLQGRGHVIVERSDPIGDVQAIWVKNRDACGVPDPRGSGVASGAAAAVSNGH
jgi:gamma-glutamyltranspeptidase/glutathione hydrolase